MDQEAQKVMLERAKQEASRWVDAINLGGSHDLNKIIDCLKGRTFEKEPCVCVAVQSFQESDFACLFMAVLEDVLAGKAVKRAKKSPEQPELIIQLFKQVVRQGFLEGMPAQLDTFLRADYTNKVYKTKVKNAANCIVDYYVFSFYESAYKAAELTNEFVGHSLFPAFQAGLHSIINFGNYLVAVAMPEVYLNERKQFSRKDGPAFIWGKHETYWYNGVEVPKEWITDTLAQDPKLAFTHRNVEQRRVFVDLCGWERIVSRLSTKQLDKSVYGTLLEVQGFDDDEGKPARFCEVICTTTGRKYVTRVPPDVQTARQALAWRYTIPEALKNPNMASEVKEDWYQPTQET